MSIKCLRTIINDEAEYVRGDVITNITKEEAERLINLKVAVKIDDKFKRSKQDLKKVYANKYKRNKFASLEGSYEF